MLYPKTRPDTAWVGLSELSAFGDAFYVIERDDQIGAAAVTTKIYRVPAADMTPAPLDGDLPTVGKSEVRNLLPDPKAHGGYVLEKVEGLAIQSDGTAWISTDNDGVDDHSGETMFFEIGTLGDQKS